jgi:CxxC motif-containing protein (DUF1111 family)
MRRSSRNFLSGFFLLALTALASSCEEATPAPDVHTTLGEELPGLPADESARFGRGRKEFMEAETPAEGLGPLFNGTSCAGCHNSGTVGGPGVLAVARAACRTADGTLVDPPGGGLVFLFSTRSDLASATLPSNCDTLARRRTTNVLGLGLIEAIPDEAILAAARDEAASVGGRAALVPDLATGGMRVGHFGWKAQQATLDMFAGDAYRNEMGITNELFPTENAPGGRADLLALMDTTPDPEARRGVVGELADFMRFSKPPEAQAPTARTSAGEALFASVGCGSCHRPVYRTADTGVSPSLAGRDVALYSDLLLHDVGTGDLIAQGAAKGTELRTPPLWGLSKNVGLLHDGRTGSVDQAIRAHAGQASTVEAAYASLSETQRADVVAFIESL